MEEAQGPRLPAVLSYGTRPMFPPQTSGPSKSRSRRFGRWGGCPAMAAVP